MVVTFIGIREFYCEFKALSLTPHLSLWNGFFDHVDIKLLGPLKQKGILYFFTKCQVTNTVQYVNVQYVKTKYTKLRVHTFKSNTETDVTRRVKSMKESEKHIYNDQALSFLRFFLFYVRHPLVLLQAGPSVSTLRAGESLRSKRHHSQSIIFEGKHTRLFIGR